MKESLQQVIRTIDELDIDASCSVVQQCLDEGVSPEEIIESGISKGLSIVGEKFESGEYFLADLVMAGEVVREAMSVLKGKMNPEKTSSRRKVILATVHGDIHEIGKNIVGLILSANGFEVIDLGVDVPAEKIIDTAKATGARLIGLSALLSTMIGSIKDVVDASSRAGLREQVRIVIGGACTSDDLRKEMGADAYGETAVDALRIFSGFTAAA